MFDGYRLTPISIFTFLLSCHFLHFSCPFISPFFPPSFGLSRTNDACAGCYIVCDHELNLHHALFIRHFVCDLYMVVQSPILFDLFTFILGDMKMNFRKCCHIYLPLQKSEDWILWQQLLIFQFSPYSISLWNNFLSSIHAMFCKFGILI